jgi:protein-S-isoprenylcysteine O-methyltransferase Ste14
VILLSTSPFEDKTLHKELAGYEKYANNFKYRLVPGFGNRERTSDGRK